MKPFIFALSLALVAPCAADASSLLPTDAGLVQQDPPMSKKEARRAARARRIAKTPQVYKGTVAEQRRIIIDAPDAEKDTGERISKKAEKRKDKDK